MTFSDDLKKRLEEDEKYIQVVAALSGSVREHVEAVSHGFLEEFSLGLEQLQDRLQDPEVRRRLIETMRGKGPKDG